MQYIKGDGEKEYKEEVEVYKSGELIYKGEAVAVYEGRWGEGI